MPGLFPQLQLIPVRMNLLSVEENGREIAQISQRYSKRRPASGEERHPCTLIGLYTID